MQIKLNFLPNAKITNEDIQNAPNKNREGILTFTLLDKIMDILKNIFSGGKGTKKEIADILFQLYPAIEQVKLTDTSMEMTDFSKNAINMANSGHVAAFFKKLQRVADDSSQRQFIIERIDDEQGKAPYYRFSITSSNINDDALLSFTGQSGWNELNQLNVDGKKFIENHSDIVIDYAKTHQDAFRAQYPGTPLEAEGEKEEKTKIFIGGEALMQCSAFFLENNPEIKQALLACRLQDADSHDQLADEIDAMAQDGQLTASTGTYQYALAILSDALNYINRTESETQF